MPLTYFPVSKKLIDYLMKWKKKERVELDCQEICQIPPLDFNVETVMIDIKSYPLTISVIFNLQILDSDSSCNCFLQIVPDTTSLQPHTKHHLFFYHSRYMAENTIHFYNLTLTYNLGQNEYL